MMVDATIFRAYDIRGEVEKQLSEALYYEFGLAIGAEAQELYKQNSILICRDFRSSSESFGAALCKGLMASGMKVVDIGILPTPLLHFAMQIHDINSGLMVTASHNPDSFNGLKVIIGGERYAGQLLKNLYYRIKEKRFNLPVSTGDYIRYEEGTVISRYIEAVSETIQLSRQLRVVVDCGNAVASVIVPRLIETLGCEVIPIYCEPRDTFSYHCPDPSIEENLQDLITAVKINHADVGFAFDGDGDRLGIVDRTGAIIRSDMQMIVLAKDILTRHPGCAVVYDVKCSKHLVDCIKEYQGIPVMSKTGECNIMAAMQQHNALLGGEFSGHFYFNDKWLNYDDGIYSAARTLLLLNDDPNLYQNIPCSFSTPELKIAISEHEKSHFIETLLDLAEFEQAEIYTIDGLRVEFAHGWGLIRCSNTTSCLTLRFEANTSEFMYEMMKVFRELILKVNPELNIPF